MQIEQVNVLLVEDDDVDAEAVIRAFESHKIANPIIVAENGIEALDILRGNGRQPLGKPYMILLDLNMPLMNGFEFLEELRDDPKLKDAIVFVLTTSKADEDITRSYESNIAGYIVKFEVGPSFQNAIDLLDQYWTTITLPT